MTVNEFHQKRSSYGYVGRAVGEVSAIQAAMPPPDALHFSDDDKEHLRVVIRLVVEFAHFLRPAASLDDKDGDMVGYVGDSTISGLDSFVSLCQAYRVSNQAVRSTLQIAALSKNALGPYYLELFSQFVHEKDFGAKCRLLLDLFKIQIVFLGLTYE